MLIVLDTFQGVLVLVDQAGMDLRMQEYEWNLFHNGPQGDMAEGSVEDEYYWRDLWNQYY